jgi:hypothetical protein
MHHRQCRTNRDFGGSSPNVDNHISAWIFDWNPHADGGSHWLGDQVNFPGAGFMRRIQDRSLFDFSDPGRDTDDNAGTQKEKRVLLRDMD